MARSARDSRLEKRTNRAKLPARGRPYYATITPEVHLGYRKLKSGGGTWVARIYVGARQYRTQTIATADDHAESDGEKVLTFYEAQERAKAVGAELTAQAESGRTGPYRIRDAVEDYLREQVEPHGRGGGPKETRRILEREVLPSIGDVKLTEISAKGLRDWLNDIAARPPQDRSGRPRRGVDMSDPEVQRRRRDTANRALRQLKAALNHAYNEGRVASDAAWRRVKAFETTSGARTRWLTRDEVTRLLNACQGGFRDLVRGGLLTGARPGDLKRLRAGDFIPETGAVWFSQRKTGRPYTCHLNAEGVEFFRRMTRGKGRSELIFTRDDGSPWGDDDHERPMREASDAARLEPRATFYTLRHTYCSHAIMAGVPMLVVANNIGHSDTRMVEKHYGHLADQYARDQIANGVPSWSGGDEDAGDNVVPMKGAQG